MQFKIEKKLDGTLVRAGRIEMPNGVIETPAFIVVGTKATVKALTPEQIAGTGAQAVLANTYHLYLQPGAELVEKSGGLGKFMNWRGPTITDSGGFQVFSLGAAYGKELSKVVKITDPALLIPERFDDSGAPRLAKIGHDGVSFRSHLDGSTHYITPEKSIEIQHQLGANIIFAFDECTSPAEEPRYQLEALERTHAWAKRCLDYHHSRSNAQTQALFGIVQGGREEALRKKSAQVIAGMQTADGKTFDGFGIGGSFAKEDMSTAVKWVNEILPEDKPRHLLGIGEPEDLLMGIENGVDLFDCVASSRMARNGTLQTKFGRLNILNTQYQTDFAKIEEGCDCDTCSPRHGGAGFSRAYLAHLFRSKEMLGATLATIHNLYFSVNLVKKIRQSILDGNFAEFKAEFLSQYQG